MASSAGMLGLLTFAKKDRIPNFEAYALSPTMGWLLLGCLSCLIIFFLVVEPEGLNRLWLNIRNYFRVWPFSY